MKQGRRRRAELDDVSINRDLSAVLLTPSRVCFTELVGLTDFSLAANLSLLVFR